MFRSYTAKMLRRGLKSLLKLKAVEEKEERVATEKAQSKAKAFNDLPLRPIVPVDPPLDPALAAALKAFNPSDPYQAGLSLLSPGGFSSIATAGTPLKDPGS